MTPFGTLMLFNNNIIQIRTEGRKYVFVIRRYEANFFFFVCVTV